MNQFVRSFILGIVAVSLLAGAALAGVIVAPTGIPYQGRLTDAGGTVINGSRALTLTLYNSGSTVIYSETQTVTVTNGLFSVEVGTGTPVTGTFAGINFTTYDLFLGVKVGTDPEMVPKIHLGVVPFSMTSKDSPGLSSLHNPVTAQIPIPNGSTGDLVSTSITIPAAGYILVMANGQVNTVAAGYVSMWISDVAGSGEDITDYGNVGSNSFPGYFQTARHRVYALGPGTYTFYFEGTIGSGAAGAYIWQPTITAIYIPLSLGSITPDPSAPGTPASRSGKDANH